MSNVVNLKPKQITMEVREYKNSYEAMLGDVIAALLYPGEKLLSDFEPLNENMFVDEYLAEIFRTALKLVEAGSDVDLIYIADEYDRGVKAQGAGGKSILFYESVDDAINHIYAGDKPAATLKRSAETLSSFINNNKRLDEIYGDTIKKPVTIELTGLLGEIQDFIYDAQIYPCREAAGMAALSIFAVTAGHRYLTPTGLKLALYIIIGMPTSTGKEWLMKSAKMALKSAGIGKRQMAMPASKPALHESLQNSEMGELVKLNPDIGKKLEEADDSKDKEKVWDEVRQMMKDGEGTPITSIIISDEIQQHLTALDKNPFKKELRDSLLEMKTATETIYPSNAVTRSYIPLAKPHLNLLGFTTPTGLFESLGDGAEANGFLNRLLVYVTDQVPPKNFDFVKSLKFEFPDDLGQALEQIAKNSQKQVAIDKEAAARMIDLDKRYLEPMKREEHGNIAGRLGEDVWILSSMFAIARDHHSPFINIKDVNHAWQIRGDLHYQLINTAEQFGGFGASQYAKIEAAIIEVIDKHHAKTQSTMSMTRLRKACAVFRNLSDDNRERLINGMVKNGEVMAVLSNRGRSFLPASNIEQ